MHIVLMFIAFLLSFGGNALSATNTGALDAEYKNDTNRVTAAVNTYQANNRGQLPSPDTINNGELSSQYLDSGRNMRIKKITANEDSELGVISVHLGKKCDGSKPSSRVFSTSTRLSDGQVFCVDS